MRENIIELEERETLMVQRSESGRSDHFPTYLLENNWKFSTAKAITVFLRKFAFEIFFQAL